MSTSTAARAVGAMPASPGGPQGHSVALPESADPSDAGSVDECDFCGLPPLLPKNAPSPAAWLVLLVIGLYRRAVSPLLPPACRFLPTCSEYGYEAVARYGIFAGGRLAIWRILRCNPFGGSGYDPVP